MELEKPWLFHGSGKLLLGYMCGMSPSLEAGALTHKTEEDFSPKTDTVICLLILYMWQKNMDVEV